MADEGQLARVGIRELRQNLSIYIERVKNGEEFDVTEHGHVVAQLVGPRKPARSLFADMVADGRVTPARTRL